MNEITRRIQQLIDDTVRQAVQRERERCADVSYTQPIGPFVEDSDIDQALIRFRLRIGDAILGTTGQEHGE